MGYQVLFTIFVYKYKMLMSDLKQLALSQFVEIGKENDDLLLNNYLSNNLALVRHIDSNLVNSAFRSMDTLMVTEMRILVVTKGWTAPVINLVKRRYEAGDLIYLGVNGLVNLEEMSEDVEGFAFSISDDLLHLALDGALPPCFDGHFRDFSLHLKPNDLEFLNQIHNLLFLSITELQKGMQITLSLICAFLWTVNNIFLKQGQTEQVELSREQRLFAEFIQLVGTYTPLQRNIGFYASRLFLSQRYMSTIIKNISGKSAKEWIDEAVVTKIKVELKHTDKTVAQISDEFEFKNNSFFSQFFKKQTGLTPLEYRNSVQFL